MVFPKMEKNSYLNIIKALQVVIVVPLLVIMLLIMFLMKRYYAKKINIRCLAGDCVNGVGISLYENGGYYHGQFKDKIFENGTLVYPGGTKYTGQFEKNFRHG